MSTAAEGLSGRMKHFIITPFYARRRFVGRPKPQLPSLEWLERRLHLFEDYCLASVIGQSARNFDWFVYFDESTPAPYLERFGLLTGKYPNIHLKLCSSWEDRTVANDVVAASASGTRWLITTRLDNDDGIHRDFVATIHAAAAERNEFLNFPRGIILYSGKCYLYRHPSNAFLSLVEPVETVRTVCSIPHELAHRYAPIRQLDEAPAFLQVLHEENVSNKPRGTRVPASRALTGFEAIGALRGLGDGETRYGIAFENLTVVSMRRIRDALISMVKRTRRLLRPDSP